MQGELSLFCHDKDDVLARPSGVMTTAALYMGDCLKVMPALEAGRFDLILTDPPYGTVKDAALDGWENGKTAWDDAIEPAEMFRQADRLARMNGAVVLFSQEPYTSRLITNASANLPFSYRMIWLKDHFANALIAKKAPVSYYEDVNVFFKRHDYEGLHPLRQYASEVLEYCRVPKRDILKRLGTRLDHFFRTSSTQFALCTRESYDDLVTAYDLTAMPGYKTFDELFDLDRRFARRFARRFNLPEGANYKSNILQYRKDYKGLHPTQKPIELMKDLVLTYTDPGDTVLDFTMGSGSTGVACALTGRNFVGIEMDSSYFDVAVDRIRTTGAQVSIFDFSVTHAKSHRPTTDRT